MLRGRWSRSRSRSPPPGIEPKTKDPLAKFGTIDEPPANTAMWLGKDSSGRKCLFADAMVVPEDLMQIAMRACNNTFWQGCSKWLNNGEFLETIDHGWTTSVALPSDAGEFEGLCAAAQGSNHKQRLRCLALALVINAALQGRIDNQTMKDMKEQLPRFVNDISETLIRLAPGATELKEWSRSRIRKSRSCSRDQRRKERSQSRGQRRKDCSRMVNGTMSNGAMKQWSNDQWSNDQWSNGQWSNDQWSNDQRPPLKSVNAKSKSPPPLPRVRKNDRNNQNEPGDRGLGQMKAELEEAENKARKYEQQRDELRAIKADSDSDLRLKEKVEKLEAALFEERKRRKEQDCVVDVAHREADESRRELRKLRDSKVVLETKNTKLEQKLVELEESSREAEKLIAARDVALARVSKLEKHNNELEAKVVRMDKVAMERLAAKEEENTKRTEELEPSLKGWRDLVHEITESTQANEQAGDSAGSASRARVNGCFVPSASGHNAPL